ncbi:MAG: cbb3-type cytochrome c oxidase subunit 3 [Pseudomonadota bacterium]|nr:cbb3-type cytochrome c oxidase subunit 3 [Pseudomonadota bacterium]
MNPIWGHIIGVVTVVLLLTFIGIWIWAWRKRHRATFQRMSRIPLEDSPETTPAEATDAAREQQR